MRSIKDQQCLQADPNRVFMALIRPSDICEWWQASSAIVFPELNGLWVARWGDPDEPDYLTAATITRFSPGTELQLSDYRYRSKSEPPPFELDVTVDFQIHSESGGESILEVRQSGFPIDSAADEYFAGCVAGWRQTLENLARFLESAC